MMVLIVLLILMMMMMTMVVTLLTIIRSGLRVAMVMLSKTLDLRDNVTCQVVNSHDDWSHWQCHMSGGSDDDNVTCHRSADD